jgi:hypothetical protein
MEPPVPTAGEANSPELHTAATGRRCFSHDMLKLLRRLFGIAFLVPALLLVPFATSAWHLLRDPGLRSAGPSSFAFQLHRSLSARLPGYVEKRIASGKAETLGPAQITATEWPVYGAFFHLLATENLQAQWEADPSLAPRAPREETAAIEASVRIMLDPGHAHWVRDYWGDDYLDDPNCFYRMLTIGSLTAHHRLTGSDEHLPLLRQLVEDLAADIDASPTGLVEDYPHQCFPADVGVAIALIRRADAALGTDRSEWARTAMRRMLANFDGGPPPYTAEASTARPLSPSRGCTNGFFFSFARDADPATLDALYQDYLAGFWQESDGCVGWREFPRTAVSPDAEWYFDPDSGPVVAGFGTSATGLGLGAARKHGDHARAGGLGAELIATALPLPGGRLLVPSLVADFEHAPHFPEIVMLHQLSIAGPAGTGKAPVPLIVWIVLVAELVVGLLSLRIAIGLLRKPRRKRVGSVTSGKSPERVPAA